MSFALRHLRSGIGSFSDTIISATGVALKMLSGRIEFIKDFDIHTTSSTSWALDLGSSQGVGLLVDGVINAATNNWISNSSLVGAQFRVSYE